MTEAEGHIESISESTQRTLEHQAGRIKELLASLAAMEASRDDVAHSARGFAEAAAIQVQVADRLQARLMTMEARLAAADRALRAISEQQPKTLEMIAANGFVFDSIGREPGNWQHLAFSIYIDLCQVDTIARAALAAESR